MHRVAGERCTMMENWVADSKRGPLRHTPEGSTAQRHSTNEKSEKIRQRHPATDWETHPERIPHNAIDHGATTLLPW